MRRSSAIRADTGTTLSAAAIAAVTALAWAELVRRNGTSGPEAFGTAYVATWTVMMTAMMLPSAAPLVLVYRRSRGGAWPVLAAVYLAVWTAIALAAYAVDRLAMEAPRAGGAALLAAGVYQL